MKTAQRDTNIDRMTMHVPHDGPERDRSEIDVALGELEMNISNLQDMYDVLTKILAPIAKPINENSQMIGGEATDGSPMSIMRQRLNCSASSVRLLRDRMDQLINHLEI
jgi:hypothetical protein